MKEVTRKAATTTPANPAPLFNQPKARKLAGVRSIHPRCSPAARATAAIVNIEAFENIPIAFATGDCNVIAGDPYFVDKELVRQEGYEGPYMVGSKLYSNDPLAIMSRADDAEFADFVNWVVHALIAADA